MSFDRFEFRDEKLYCKDCGSEVERGIVNVANHWTSCGGKDFHNALIEMAENHNGKLTLGNIDFLNDKFNNHE